MTCVVGTHWKCLGELVKVGTDACMCFRWDLGEMSVVPFGCNVYLFWSYAVSPRYLCCGYSFEAPRRVAFSGYPQHIQVVFFCVEVLRPSQPNGVMSNGVSLPNHTFTGQA